MEMIIVLFISTPIALAIWLIIRAMRADSQIKELSRRVDNLQLQLAQMKRPEPAAAKTAKETVPPAAPAVPPPLKTVREFVVPAISIQQPIPIVPPPVITPPVEIATPVPTTELASKSAFGSAQAQNPAEPALPVTEKSSFEMRLGTFWLARVGIVMLLTGLVFFANYAYHHIIGRLGPAGKISLLYLASGLLLGAGAWWQRRNVKESLKNYAQVLFAGGLAAVYFTTYAAHHILPLRIINSAVVDGVLLLAWAGVIAWLADRRKSEVMAIFAVGLAFYSSIVTRVGEFTLYSNLILTVAVLVFLVRNRWTTLSFTSLVTSYAGYAFWRFIHDEGWRWAGPGQNLWLGVGFLASYWLVFTAATFLSRSPKLSGPNRATFLTLNNGAFFMLFVLTLIQTHSGGFWKICLGYGIVLLALAGFAKTMLPDERLAKGTYLSQGLLLVTLGFISKFAGLQLAPILGVESVVLFLLGTQRPSFVLKFFAYAAGLLATGWCVANLKQFNSDGLWTGSALGLMMVFNAFWAHRKTAESNLQPLRAEPSFFVLLAFAGWLATTWFNTTAGNLPLVLAAETVALTFSFYLLRIREITLLGQLFLVLAQAAWFQHFLNAKPPWWNPLILIAVGLGLSHWWQKQKILVMKEKEKFSTGCQTIFALAAVALVMVWLHPLVHAPAWLAITSLLAVVTTFYGVITRAWPLAICGQIFLAASIWEFLVQIWNGQSDWFFPIAPIAMLGMLSLATLYWFARKPDSPAAVRQPLLQVALVYRWMALIMSFFWFWQYIPNRQLVGAFMLASIAIFAFAIRRRNREALLAAAIYATVAVATLWSRTNLEMDVYWVNLLALLTLLAMQQVLRLKAKYFSLDEKIHGAIIFIAGISLWRLASCWAGTFTGGFFITMIWAGFAVLMFAAGVILRERFHRWLGLSVLAAAVGRVVMVDVWKQETIYRVLTFMALGMALLVIGFIYNKYQEKIRQWL